MIIVYVTDQLYLHGGIERIVSAKINYLLKNTIHQIVLITTNQKNQPFVYELDGQLTHYDLAIEYDLKKSPYHPKNWIKILVHFIKLKSLLSTILPDVLVSVNFFVDQYFYPFITKSKLVKEIHFMGEAIRKNLNFIDRWLFSKIMPKYHHLILLNQDEKQFYLNFSNLGVIPNFIDPPYNQSPLDHEKKNWILSAGRLAPVKQFDHLISAFSKISNEVEDWELHIYGNDDGNMKQNLLTLIKKLGQNEKIFIHDAVPTILDKMQESSVYAMTSATECFPMVLLEAKSVGLPIISYDCKFGPRHIIKNKQDGILVKDQDINEFSKQLLSMIKNKELRLKMADLSKENVKEFYSTKVMEKWIKLFENNE